MVRWAANREGMISCSLHFSLRNEPNRETALPPLQPFRGSRDLPEDNFPRSTPSYCERDKPACQAVSTPPRNFQELGKQALLVCDVMRAGLGLDFVLLRRMPKRIANRYFLIGRDHLGSACSLIPDHRSAATIILVRGCPTDC